MRSRGGPEAGRRALWLRLLRGAALAVVGALLAGEVILQLASIFAPDRTSPWREGASERILCIGDSHTYGAGVERDESYPAQLQRVLDGLAPGRYAVMNLRSVRLLPVAE